MRGQFSGRLRAAQKSGSEQAGGTSSRCRLARAWHRLTRLSRAQAANAPNSVKECDVDAARLARGSGVRGGGVRGWKARGGDMRGWGGYAGSLAAGQWPRAPCTS
jgi:hypothetical protein